MSDPAALTDPAPAALAQPAATDVAPRRSELMETVLFLVKLAVAVVLLRGLIVSPFNIPSQSMLPRLYIGDYLFVSKWPYGYSRYSLPMGFPPVAGRLFGRLPERGDVVVFKAPPANSADYIKRVIGLPGDTIQMRGGQVILNGVPVPRVRVADFEIPISPNYPIAPTSVDDRRDGCPPEFAARNAQGQQVCRYTQYRETLPNGKSFMTLDRGMRDDDNTGVYTVPAGHVFMMGDNRDDSEDSRFSIEQHGIGYVPIDNIEGRADLMFWSTDGSASIFLPWTWFGAARWQRIGSRF